MTNIDELYQQYQASESCVKIWQNDVNASKESIESANQRLGGLEENLNTAKSVCAEKESALSEAISGQISEQRVALTRASRALKKGDVESAYLLLTGQEKTTQTIEEAVEIDMYKLVQAKPIQTAKPEIVLRMAVSTIYGVDRNSEKQLWAYEVHQCVPVFAQDEKRVFVPVDNKIVVLDKENGKEVPEKGLEWFDSGWNWRKRIYGLVEHKGRLYVASDDGIAAYEAELFLKSWEDKSLSAFQLAKSGENLFINGFDGLRALDPECGLIRWNKHGRDVYNITGGAGDEGSVYAADCWKEEIKKIDKDGKEMWTSKTDPDICHAIMKAHNNRLYVLSKCGGNVRALDADCGKVIWESQIKERDTFPWQIEVADKGLEICVSQPYYSRESKVIRFDPETGKQL